MQHLDSFSFDVISGFFSPLNLLKKHQLFLTTVDQQYHPLCKYTLHKTVTFWSSSKDQNFYVLGFLLLSLSLSSPLLHPLTIAEFTFLSSLTYRDHYCLEGTVFCWHYGELHCHGKLLKSVSSQFQGDPLTDCSLQTSLPALQG